MPDMTPMNILRTARAGFGARFDQHQHDRQVDNSAGCSRSSSTAVLCYSPR